MPWIIDGGTAPAKRYPIHGKPGMVHRHIQPFTPLTASTGAAYSSGISRGGVS
ncbi:hypothetical protein [Acidovorax sp. GW101-3H11]|uniref:hypothetical protein n=1 Tax=Acidovorax sp. GW101-3H11 TaxID=1813946 RepID=UPI0012FF73D3|nr:hypothetical protein [Acidovorax sp. GW101-3H11]